VTSLDSPPRRLSLPPPTQRRRPPLPAPLGLLAVLVLLAVGSPLSFVVVQAVSAGWEPVRALLHRPLAMELI